MQQVWQQFLQEQGFTCLTTTGISQPDIGKLTQTQLTELSNYGSLMLSGSDSHGFLQGQLSCNLDDLQTHRGLRGAYCTPKGSVIGNFDLICIQDQIMMHMAADLVAHMQSALAKYMVFSNTTSHDQSQNWVRLGVWGDNAHEVVSQLTNLPLSQHASAQFASGVIFCSHVKSQRFVIYCRPESAPDVWRQLADVARPTATAQWEIDQMQDGVVYVSAATSATYIPQVLNLQALGAINFQKGCYTGQEIVARMQYLGKLKRHLHIGRINSNKPLAVGMSITASNQNNVGRIINLAQEADNLYWFCGVINRKEAQIEKLHICGVKDSSITLSPLPYTIDKQVFERIKL